MPKSPPDEATDLFDNAPPAPPAEADGAEDQQQHQETPPEDEEGMNEAEKDLALLGSAKETLSNLGLTLPPHEFYPGSEPDVGPGIYLGVSEEAYHDHPALSRSVLAEAARMSPLHAYYRWKGEEGEDTSDAASLGTALHTRVLQPDLYEETYDVAAEQCEATKGDGDRCSYSAKVRHDGTWYCGTHAPNDSEPDDIEVLKSDTAGDVESMAGALEMDPDAGSLLYDLPGLPEVTILWKDEATGLMCKARPDRIVGLPEGVAIVDLKSTRSAHPEDFRRKMARYGYWMQQPFYSLGLRQAAESDVTIKDFVFTCVESSAPYAVQCYRLHGKDLSGVRRRTSQLMDEIAECEREDQWPSYADGIRELGMKSYEKDRLGISG